MTAASGPHLNRDADRATIGVKLAEYGNLGAKMSELEKLEQRIQGLPPEELKRFRAWFAEFDARVCSASS